MRALRRCHQAARNRLRNGQPAFAVVDLERALDLGTLTPAQADEARRGLEDARRAKR